MRVSQLTHPSRPVGLSIIGSITSSASTGTGVDLSSPDSGCSSVRPRASVISGRRCIQPALTAGSSLILTSPIASDPDYIVSPVASDPPG